MRLSVETNMDTDDDIMRSSFFIASLIILGTAFKYEVWKLQVL